MKLFLATAAVTALLAGPALAQTATQTITDAVTKSATEAVTKAATDQIDKAAGTKADDNAKDGKKAKDKAKKVKDSAPNYGSSMEHRMDDEMKGHGKNKKKK